MSKDDPQTPEGQEADRLFRNTVKREPLAAAPCSLPFSLPSRSELSIRISDALDILDDLEKAKVIYGGFAKEQLRRIRATLKPPTENERKQL